MTRDLCCCCWSTAGSEPREKERVAEMSSWSAASHTLSVGWGHTPGVGRREGRGWGWASTHESGRSTSTESCLQCCESGSEGGRDCDVIVDRQPRCGTAVAKDSPHTLISWRRRSRDEEEGLRLSQSAQS